MSCRIWRCARVSCLARYGWPWRVRPRCGAARRGLDADTAIQLLRLVRKEILRPVPGGPIPLPSEVNADRDVDTRRLLDAGVAVGRGTKPGDELALSFDDYDGINDPEQAAAGLRIHPDVMFGLGLAERPAPASAHTKNSSRRFSRAGSPDGRPTSPLTRQSVSFLLVTLGNGPAAQHPDE